MHAHLWRVRRRSLRPASGRPADEKFPFPLRLAASRVTHHKRRLEQPRLLHVHNFLSPDECDHLIGLARPDLARNLVFAPDGGHSLDTGRTSSGTGLHRYTDHVIVRVDRRLARLAMVPEENGEDLQVLRYAKGELYVKHADLFEATMLEQDGGWQRMASVISYLTDVAEGGETIFPNGIFLKRGDGADREHDEGSSDCVKDQLMVRPSRGDAVFFFNTDTATHDNMDSFHASCPVIQGEKWVATKWIHVTGT